MAPRNPPRYVPTLTEVVKGAAPPAPAAASALSQEQLVQRVMQRVDLTLDRRLREAIGAVVLEQARAIGPLLRGEMEAVVREAVAQALADELANAPRTRR